MLKNQILSPNWMRSCYKTLVQRCIHVCVCSYVCVCICVGVTVCACFCTSACVCVYANDRNDSYIFVTV